MRSRRLLVLATIAGCGGSPAPAPAKAAAPAPAPRVEPPCITTPDGPANVTLAGSFGSRIYYCVGPKHDQCFTYDTGTGALERLPEPPQVTANHVARVKAVSPSLEVCLSDSCKALTPIVLPKAAQLRAATNASGTVAVVLLGDAARGEGYAEVWDVAKARRAATFRYARGDFRCGDVAILGETIYISANTCGSSPAARAALYTQKGRKIANVGGRDFGAFGDAFAHVDGATWAFLEENANRLAIQDVVTGKIVKTIDTSFVFQDHGAEMGNPGESALIKLADGTLALIAGAPATGNVAMIDVARSSMEIKRAPVCPTGG